MRLSKEALEEFKEIYSKEFGVELSDKDAQKIAIRLLRLFFILRYKPRHALTIDKGSDSVNQKG